MATSIFATTASALGYAIVQQRCGLTPSDRDFPHNAAVRFVLSQHERMPDYLRFPIVFLTLLFACSSLLGDKMLFHRLPPERRWQYIERWRTSPIGFCRDLIRFYEGLIVFFCYATLHTYVRERT